MDAEAFQVLLLALDFIRLDIIGKDAACKRAAVELITSIPLLSPGGASDESEPHAPRATLIARFLSKQMPWIPQDVWLVLDLYSTSVQIADHPSLLNDVGVLRGLQEFARDLCGFGVEANNVGSSASAHPLPPPSVCQAVRSAGEPLLRAVEKLLLVGGAITDVASLVHLIRALRRVAANRATMAVLQLAPQLTPPTTGSGGHGGQLNTAASDPKLFEFGMALLDTLIRFGQPHPPHPSVMGHASGSPKEARKRPRGTEEALISSPYSHKNVVRAATFVVDSGRRRTDGGTSSSSLTSSSVSSQRSQVPSSSQRERMPATTVDDGGIKAQLQSLFDTPQRAAMSIPLFRDGSSAPASDDEKSSEEGSTELPTPSRVQPLSTAAPLSAPSSFTTVDDDTPGGRKTTPAPLSQTVAIRPEGNDIVRKLQQEAADDGMFALDVSEVIAAAPHDDVSMASSSATNIAADLSIVADSDKLNGYGAQTRKGAGIVFAPPIQHNETAATTNVGAPGIRNDEVVHATPAGLATAGLQLSGSRTYILVPASQRYVPAPLAGFYDQ